jgi:DNA-binding transcriptional regulator PaaX
VIDPTHDDEDEVQALARSLSRYLRDNPQASDTAEGISLWWLRLDWQVHEFAVRSALARLVKAGLVEEVKGPDGRVRYRRVQTADAALALEALAASSANPPSNGGGKAQPKSN